MRGKRKKGNRAREDSESRSRMARVYKREGSVADDFGSSVRGRGSAERTELDRRVD